MGLDLWGELPRLDLIDCYLKSGWNVCPLRECEKRPVCGRARWAQLDRDAKIDRFYHNPELGVGLWLDSSLCIFDYDSDRQPEDTLVAVRGSHSHNYFTGTDEIYNTSKQVAPDIDTRADGGLIVLPPTRHTSGDSYQWQALTAPVAVPPSLMALWRTRQATGLPSGYSLSELPAVIPQGQRDATLWSYGRRLKASGVDFDCLDFRLRQVNRERCRPPLPEREVSRKIAHIWRHRNKPDWNLS
jgi:hypothetical protein